MNRVFRYQNGEIKVMWDEISMHKDYEEKVISRIIKQKTKEILNSFSVGVELKINRGGRICYGMLMARVQSQKQDGCVKTHIAYTQKNTTKYENSFLQNDEFVYKGLPKEYVVRVNDDIYKAIIEKESYPQCDIFFEYAANCQVGSSPMIFGIIAEMIINIIYMNSVNEILNISIKDFTEKYVKKINMRY